MQLDLFSLPPTGSKAKPLAPEPDTRAAGIVWVRRPCSWVDRTSPLAQYTHLIRGKDDPPETRARGAGTETTGWKKFKSGDVETWKAKILGLMGDGLSRTWNHIAIEVTGYTADILVDSQPEHALWALVDDGALAHTLGAPILFSAVEVPACCLEDQASREVPDAP